MLFYYLFSRRFSFLLFPLVVLCFVPVFVCLSLAYATTKGLYKSCFCILGIRNKERCLEWKILIFHFTDMGKNLWLRKITIYLYTFSIHNTKTCLHCCCNFKSNQPTKYIHKVYIKLLKAST